MKRFSLEFLFAKCSYFLAWAASARGHEHAI